MVGLGRWLDAAGARGKDRLGLWLAGAVVLHASALLGLAAWVLASAPSEPRFAPAKSVPSLWVDLLWDESAPELKEEQAPVRTRAGLRAKGPSLAPSAAVAASLSAAAASNDPPSRNDPSPDDVAPPLDTPRRLSLAQLGIGVQSQPSLLDLPASPSNGELATQRLNDSLSTGLAMGDSARGLGIEGTAVRAVTELAMDSALPLATSARLLLLVDATGGAESVSLLEVGADRTEWQRIAEALRRRLSDHALRLPAGSVGARLQLVVTSQPLSASGARQGLDAELFRKAKRAPGTPSVGRVSLLPREPETLRAQFPVLEGAHPQPMAGFSTNILSASADLSDTGGGLHRSVTARLAYLDVRMAASIPPEQRLTTPPAAP